MVQRTPAHASPPGNSMLEWFLTLLLLVSGTEGCAYHFLLRGGQNGKFEIDPTQRRGAATETNMQEFRYNFEKLHGFKIKSVWAAIEAAGAALGAGAGALAAGAAAEEAREEQPQKHGWMDGWMDGRTDGRTVSSAIALSRSVASWACT